MKYKHIFFDFDGTLIDTIPGITAALNTLNKKLNNGVTYKDSDTINFVGNGAEKLFLRAFKFSEINESNKPLFDRFLSLYYELQLDNMNDFPYVHEVLKELMKQNVNLYIYSNKPHELLKKCVLKCFKDYDFKLILGAKPELIKKPNPFVINNYLKENNINKNEVLYVGDSMPDLKFSKNLGVDSLILTYGYGDYEAIKEEHPTYLEKDIRKLLEL